MAVERMKLMNIVLPRPLTYQLLRHFLLEERVEFIDARKMIDETSFLLQAAVENARQIQELNTVDRFAIDYDLDADVEKFRLIQEKTKFKAKLDLDYLRSMDHFFHRDEALEELFKGMHARLKPLEELDKVLADLEPYEKLADMGVDYPLGKLLNMQNLICRLGWVGRAAHERLVRCAEEIPPIFVDLGKMDERHICLFVYPHDLQVESERIIRSLDLTEIELAEPYRDLSLQTELRDLLRQKREERANLQEKLDDYVERNKAQVDRIYSMLVLETKIRELTQYLGKTEHFAYLSVWTPADRTDAIREYVENQLSAVTSVLSSKNAGVYEKAPTSLRNNPLVAPFEQLVYMYGIPNYNEIDPSSIFAVVYMLLFGMMFGDLGQGLVIILAGFLLKKLKGSSFGSLLMRLGCASSFFGFFYDSFFGYERAISHVLPGRWYLHPFDNTSSILLAAVVIGLVLLAFSYGLSVVNKLRTGQRMEAWLGKEGAVGFLLFISLLATVASVFGLIPVPFYVPVAGLAIGGILLLFHEPIWNLSHGIRPLYAQKRGEYYVESGFSLVEAFLSLLSNSLSFVRVGAFALNHVGLFVAFHTLAKMLNTTFASIGIGLIGNILVLVLEGMVVFIQGLRLMYYELFSKYFVGEGRPFKAARLQEVQL